MDPSEEIIDEYFEYLADRDVYRAPTVLSWLTDYIDTKNENAIYKLLQHSLASEAVAGLVDLLEFDDKRLTESVVHILGTIVEHPRCRQYVLEVPRNTATIGQSNPTLFTALVNMLMSEDKNVVMNAAGTIANIAESPDGRLWILQQAVFDDALPILGVLTVDPHQWAASNSALVLARLTLSQEGIVKILTHERSSYVLINLSSALCGHNPGSSMNAAFAVGRLLEREDARSKLLAMKNFKNTMTALTKMLYNKEAGPRKNACFAFSCLANSKEGHDRLLSNVNSELILDQLVRLITDTDDETAWFAAVTLRSVGSQKEGVFRLRDHKSVHAVLKKLVRGGGVKLKSDLLTEVKMTLDILGKLPKLPAPIMTAIDSFSVSARWESIIATPNNRVTYQLFQGCTCVYEGPKTSTTVKKLKPFTSYVFRIRATNSADEGPYSGPALITTNEGVPGPPGEVNNEGKPQHNSIKISWTAPPNPNGTLTGYNIYSDGKRVGVVGVDKLSYTVKDLPHSTSIPIQVAPVTAAGEGEKSVPIMCSTLNLSDYPPKKPILSTSGGANEINVSWIDPPKQLGPIDHYELVMNGEVIYSGKEQGFRVSNLEPLTNYTFNVRVVTADKYVIESEPAKKKAGSKEEAGISSKEKEALIAERDAMEARLKAELTRLKALEEALKQEEMIRRQEVEHKLQLGSRGGPAYGLDDPDVTETLSGSLLDKLRAAGITDISMLEEKDILALGLTEDELNNLLDAIYMAKYLKASPKLMKFLKDAEQDPLTLWKLNYEDVNNMPLSEELKKELFGHVLSQQTSFVANLEIPTSRNIILKGWKDENLAFIPRHDAKLVTKNFKAKEELNDYIEKLRAVVQKNGGLSGTESEVDLPEVEQNRTPTPEIAKPVSDTREIIRPKKKADRFTVNKKQSINDDKKSTKSPRKPVPRDDSRQSLATIDEVSSSIVPDTPTPTPTAPMGISEVVVTRTKVPPNTSDSSISSAQQESSSVKPDYVTSYEAKSEGGDAVVTSVSKDESAVKPEANLSQYFAGKTYNHALTNLEDSVREESGTEQVSQTEKSGTSLPRTEQSEETNSESKSLDPESKSLDTTSYTSFSSGSNQKIGITSLSSLGSVGTTSQSESMDASLTSLNATAVQDGVLPSSSTHDSTAVDPLSQILDSLGPQKISIQGQPSHTQSSDPASHVQSHPGQPTFDQPTLGQISGSQITHGQSNRDNVDQSDATQNNRSQDLTPHSQIPQITNDSSQAQGIRAKQFDEDTLQIPGHSLLTNSSGVAQPQEPRNVPPMSYDDYTTQGNIQPSVGQMSQNQPFQRQPSQFQISLDSIPQYQSQRSSNQTSQNQPLQNQLSQHQTPQKTVPDGTIPQVQISFDFDNINSPKSHPLQKAAYQDSRPVGRKNQRRLLPKPNTPQDHIPDERSRRISQSSDELNAARSLNDILLVESDQRKFTSNDMTAEQNDHAQGEDFNYKPDYKSHRKRFNIDDERMREDGVDEQNKLITALIAQQNSDYQVQNRQTKQLINTVRNNIKNAIQSKRDHGQFHHQLSSNNKFSAANTGRRSVKISSVNMFGEMADFPQRYQRPTVNMGQAKTSPLQGRRKQRRRKQQQPLPSIHRQGPATADIQFHFPKL